MPRRHPEVTSMSSDELERGEIFFFYRPRQRPDDDPGPDVVRSLDDVERLFLVLHSPARNVFRRIALIMGAGGLVGVVEEVSPATEDVADALLRGAYDGGGVARPAGEGSYRLSAAGDRLRLDYRLTLPAAPSATQAALGIAHSARLLLHTAREPLNHRGTTLSIHLDGDTASYPADL
jgi:hypothetical protein